MRTMNSQNSAARSRATAMASTRPSTRETRCVLRARFHQFGLEAAIDRAGVRHAAVLLFQPAAGAADNGPFHARVFARRQAALEAAGKARQHATDLRGGHVQQPGDVARAQAAAIAQHQHAAILQRLQRGGLQNDVSLRALDGVLTEAVPRQFGVVDEAGLLHRHGAHARAQVFAQSGAAAGRAAAKDVEHGALHGVFRQFVVAADGVRHVEQFAVIGPDAGEKGAQFVGLRKTMLVILAPQGGRGGR